LGGVLFVETRTTDGEKTTEKSRKDTTKKPLTEKQRVLLEQVKAVPMSAAKTEALQRSMASYDRDTPQLPSPCGDEKSMRADLLAILRPSHAVGGELLSNNKNILYFLIVNIDNTHQVFRQLTRRKKRFKKL
jgi:hypothetical protein